MQTIIIAIIDSGALSAVISGVFGLIQSRKRRKDGLRDGVRVMLYDRIKHPGRKYIAAAEISAEDLEDLIAMHTIYHELDGNGFLDRLMDQVKGLPIQGKGQEEH